MCIDVKKISLKNGRILYAVYKKLKLDFKGTLKSQIEINSQNLFKIVGKYGSRVACFVCEGGWYFNNPRKILKEVSVFRLFYFILSPALKQLRRNYISRHPRTKKSFYRDSDWIKYEAKIFRPMLGNNEKLKKKLNFIGIEYCEFINEQLEIKVNKIKNVIENTVEPSIFIITGPNASGKSTLFLNLLKSYDNE